MRALPTNERALAFGGGVDGIATAMALQLESVTRRYGEQLALDSVSVHVRDGDCYGFIGHNGAGKTTAMRIALGLQRPDSGRVWVDGFDAARHPSEARARLGGLIETPGFHPQLDGAANLCLLARLQGLSKQAAALEARRLLELVGLEHVGAKQVHAYSQGMRQRLGIAQALIGRPRYVLLDEPTNGLDPQGIAEIRVILRRLTEDEGLTVLLSSHQLHEIADLCNRIGVMHRGKLVVEAETRALLESAPGSYELATSDDARALQLLAAHGIAGQARSGGGLELQLGGRSPGEVARLVVTGGLELQRCGVHAPSLEEIYLRYARGETIVAPLTPLASLAATGATSEDVPPQERRAPPGALLRVARYEASRWLAKKRFVALLALPALAGAAAVSMAKSGALEQQARVAAGELASATAMTAFQTSAMALKTGLPLLALIVAGFASQMIAGELARGTLRNVLLRPHTRLQVVLGKALAGAGFTLFAYALLVASAVALSAWSFGFHDLVEILPGGQTYPLISASELWPELQRALLAMLAPLLGYFALGFVAGSFARTAAGALGLALGAHLALDLARSIARGFGTEGWLLSAYLPSPLGDTSYLHVYADRAEGISNSVFDFDARWFAFVPQDVGVPLAWCGACIVVSALLLARRSVP